MWISYLKIAYRNLMRNRVFTLINLFGLSIGIAGSILILLWVHHEINFDRFHDKLDRLYEVWNKEEMNGEIVNWNYTSKPLGPTLLAEYPEIASMTRFGDAEDYLLANGEKKLTQKVTVVDKAFLSMFDFPLIKGDLQTYFSRPESIVLTESAAQRLFGHEEAMGQLVIVEKELAVTVTGILKDLPDNTQFQFDGLLSWSLWKQLGYEDEHWGNNSVRTYVELHPHVSLKQANASIKGVVQKHSKERNEVMLYPVSRMHLYGSFENGKEAGGKITLVTQFILIAFFILLIACVNFMNLSTARSEKRAREVGIRKLSGAGRGKLIAQFISESVILTLVASVLGFLMAGLFLPQFNSMMASNLVLPVKNEFFWLLFIGFVFFTGVFSGSYPAFFLSAFIPVKVLKGNVSSPGSAFSLRKVLVVFQFALAVILISATLIVRQQIDYVQSRNAGFERDQLVYHSYSKDMDRNYETFRNEMLESGAVNGISRTLSPLSEVWSSSTQMSWQGHEERPTVDIDRMTVDADFVQTAGLRLLQGRDIDGYNFIADSISVLLNQSAVQAMGFNDPVGEVIIDNGREWKVVGVVADFVISSPFNQIDPMVIFGPQSKNWFNFVHFKLNPSNTIAENLSRIEKVFAKHNPDFPFDFKFVDQEYEAKFLDQKRTGKLTLMFASLAIAISCLGLFGLAAFMAEQRLKEIGVRKVLGASSGTIIALLTGDFLKLVFISIILAIPISWYIMNNWLGSFQYRISISWQVFFLAGTVALVIAFLTVSSQAIKAALMNPVESLRSE